jgi:adenylyl- and sulfurtransferase ThiI
MRVVLALCAAFLTICTVSGTASALGLYVEQVQDQNVYRCPVCQRVITPGGIHETALTTLASEFGEALASRGIKYSQEPGQARYLNVLIFRFQERRGGNFAVERRRASVFTSTSSNTTTS